MPLRAKLLALFLFLAVVPILALGGVEYFRQLRAVESLIATQNTRLADRIAAFVDQRAARLQSDLLLLAENVETQRWLANRAAGGSDPAAARLADRFVREAWGRMSASYAGLDYRSPEGDVIYALGGDAGGAGGLEPVAQAVRSAVSGARLGTVTVRPVPAALLPLDLLESGFGETGAGMVLDRRSGGIVYHAEPAVQAGGTALALPGVAPAALDRVRGTFRYTLGDTVRIAAYRQLRALPWTVVVSASLDEFSSPFVQVGRTTVALFVAVGALTALAFGHLLRRTTRSLEDLTAATAVVGQGNFEPRLPPAGRDEVGRLAGAFGAMVARVRDMVAEIRTSRQMAVLGGFAAHLSHEVRNPLTSIKLNLQTLERDRRAGRLPEDAGPPLEIALAEVARLDRVVRGVLDLARERAPVLAPHSLRQLAEEALDVVARQAEERGVALARAWGPEHDTVLADAALIKGALLNLCLNALDAMPGGGTLRLATTEAGAGRIRLSVADTGPGIPATERESVFLPFRTGKDGGTGLGLPLARRAVEDHGGTLTLAPDRGAGAEFVMELPRQGAA